MDGSVSMHVRFPARFLAAAISNPPGYHSRGFYLDEARRIGLRILPLDVNASRLAYHGGEDWIRPGLSHVAGCRATAMQVLVQERDAKGPYSDPADLLERVPLNRREAGNLILAGGMGCFGMTRPELLRHLDAALPAAGPSGRRGVPRAMAGEALAAFGPDGDRDYCLMRKCLLELDLLECALSADLRKAVEIHSSARGAVRASELGRYAGARVRVAGIPLTQRLRPAVFGGTFAEAVSIGDATGRMDVGFRARALERCEREFSGGEPLPGKVLEVAGMVREAEGEFWVDAEEARLAPWPGFVDFGVASRRLMEGSKTFPAYAEAAGSLAA